MTCWAIIPIKASFASKSRLASVLDATERKSLAQTMAKRVCGAVLAARGVDRICLLGPSRLGLPDELELLPDPGQGLNAAIASAFEHASNSGASRAIFIHADLPMVTSEDVTLLANAAQDEISIAPDRHRTGTNALSLPLPAARAFDFAFGVQSFARHSDEIARLRLRARIVDSVGLASDIDEPDDYYALCEGAAKV